jgi:hypothetical protein
VNTAEQTDDRSDVLTRSDAEQKALRDICLDAKHLCHERSVYASLKAKGLIAVSIGGHWMATATGRRADKAKRR